VIKINITTIAEFEEFEFDVNLEFEFDVNLEFEFIKILISSRVV